jgi:hypothetical protein
MNNYTIFISSSDAYADLWPIFFDLFKKYWPEYDGIIYLNTEKKAFFYEGFNIVCTQVGKNSFGNTFRSGLQKVESPYLLLIMIDYFFMGKINHEALGKYFFYFRQQNLDTLCLMPSQYSNIEKLEFEDVYRVIPPSKDMFSYQAAFWKKSVLFEMALPHETPWLSEWYGTARANQMKLKLAYLATEKPIPYLMEGALHKGKWVTPMVSFLKEIVYDVDFSKRGLFEDIPFTLFDRVKARLVTFWPRCLSNFDLLKKMFKK